MAETPSQMLPLGAVAPDFSLKNVVDGRVYSLSDFEDGKSLLVMFICNHCPYVQHVLPEFKRLDEDYAEKGLRIVAINSNDIDSYPQDAPEPMRQLAEAEGWAFPYLLDEDQKLAKAFRAACTPDFFLFDQDRNLAYRGKLDDARPNNSAPVDGKNLRAAIEALLCGRQPSEDQQPSLGCNIKWKKGNEPDYF